MPRRALIVLPALLLSLAACRNSCQATCQRMARYAERDCGLVVPAGEVAACMEAFAQPSGEERRTCRQDGDLGTIRELWSCDDMADYFPSADQADAALAPLDTGR
jgi:hypothetical protein